MGTFNKLKQENPKIFSRPNNEGGNQQEENIPLILLDFEIGGTLEKNYVIGERIDTKEKVKIRLSDIEQKSSKYKRPEISEFADSKNKKRYVPIGSPMVFESSRRQPDNTYISRWGVVLDREKDLTKVQVFKSRLTSGKTERDGIKFDWFRIQILPPINPIKIDSKESFDNALKRYLSPKTKGSNPELFVRLTDETGDVIVEYIRHFREEVEEDGRTIKRAASGERSFEFFVENETDKYNLFVGLISDPNVTVEILPSTSIYPGSATSEKMGDMNDKSKKILLENYHIKKENEDNQDGEENSFPEVGFVDSVIATRSYEDGSPYLTYIKPLNVFSKGLAESIKTVQPVKK